MGGDKRKEKSVAQSFSLNKTHPERPVNSETLWISILSWHVFHAQITQNICSCPNSKDPLSFPVSLHHMVYVHQNKRETWFPQSVMLTGWEQHSPNSKTPGAHAQAPIRFSRHVWYLLMCHDLPPGLTHVHCSHASLILIWGPPLTTWRYRILFLVPPQALNLEDLEVVERSLEFLLLRSWSWVTQPCSHHTASHCPKRHAWCSWRSQKALWRQVFPLC